MGRMPGGLLSHDARPKRLRRPIWRLDLACGHTAYALEREPHGTGSVYFCHVEKRLARIVDSGAAHFHVPVNRARRPIRM